MCLTGERGQGRLKVLWGGLGGMDDDWDRELEHTTPIGILYLLLLNVLPTL